MVRLRTHGRKADLPSTDERTPLFEQLLNATIATDPFSSDYFLESICAGIRYEYTFYIAITIQPYIFVLGQLAKCGPMISYNDSGQNRRIETSTSSFGYQFGAGIDFGILPYVGIFIECAYGYATLEFPNGKKYNGDSQSVYIGASFCTSYGLIE